MKKTYKIPAIRVANIDFSELLAESNISLSEQAAKMDYEGGGDVKEEKYNLWNNRW